VFARHFNPATSPSKEVSVPVGKVKWYDTEKGFGLLTKDEDGGEVFVRSSALPSDVTTLRKGQKVEFGVIAGRKGDQALSVRVIDAPASVVKARRKKPEEMVVIVEDLIKLLDSLQNSYRRERQPEAKSAEKMAAVMRAVADELDMSKN
jgi:CspA family cold shock protein